MRKLYIPILIFNFLITHTSPVWAVKNNPQRPSRLAIVAALCNELLTTAVGAIANGSFDTPGQPIAPMAPHHPENLARLAQVLTDLTPNVSVNEPLPQRLDTHLEGLRNSAEPNAPFTYMQEAFERIEHSSSYLRAAGEQRLHEGVVVALRNVLFVLADGFFTTAVYEHLTRMALREMRNRLARIEVVLNKLDAHPTSDRIRIKRQRYEAIRSRLIVALRSGQPTRESGVWAIFSLARALERHEFPERLPMTRLRSNANGGNALVGSEAFFDQALRPQRLPIDRRLWNEARRLGQHLQTGAPYALQWPRGAQATQLYILDDAFALNPIHGRYPHVMQVLFLRLAERAGILPVGTVQTVFNYFATYGHTQQAQELWNHTFDSTHPQFRSGPEYITKILYFVLGIDEPRFPQVRQRTTPRPN